MTSLAQLPMSWKPCLAGSSHCDNLQRLWHLQVQVADIGLMGGPAKFNGKATEGVRIFLGGSIGEGAQLASEFEKGVACEESVLLPKLRELLVERFGAVPKAGVLAEA